MIQFESRYDAVSFDQIRPEHFRPAIEETMGEARKAIDKIVKSSVLPDFKNTIEPLERSGYRLKRLQELLFNLNLADTTSEIQQITREISPLLTEFYNDITMNRTLYSKVKQVKEREDHLSQEQSRLLHDTYRTFVRNGADLKDDAIEEYREITRELAVLSLRFSENVLQATNIYHLHITDEKDLSGLPEFAIEAAVNEAGSQKKEGWLFTLKAPSYLSFMKYADNRNLREEMYRAYNSRCFCNNEMDNREIIRKIVNLRRRKANMLGYQTYADYVLEERMAQNPENVNAFIRELLKAALPFANQEISEIQSYARKSNKFFKLMPWDWMYFSEKVKNEKFAVTDEMTKPYFMLEHVLQRVFELAGMLFDLRLIPDDDLSKYHPDVRIFRIYHADGTLMALLYLDFFPRKNKQGGAWMTNFLEQHIIEGDNIRPHVSLVFNFTNPFKDKPSLITYDELRTLLHEFGHALHSVLSNCTYMSQAGTNVYLDFVELPSQIMENWAEEKEWLDMVAIHYKTGDKMPEEMLQNILNARNFNRGFAFVRQLGFAMNDMAWHTLKNDLEVSVEEFEDLAMTSAALFPKVDGCNFSTIFSHIFGGGYASGYYGYKWAEVLDADAFSVFRKQGIFNRTTANAFMENILSRGGTEHPMELYKRFRGQEPSLEHLLLRSGLKKE